MFQTLKGAHHYNTKGVLTNDHVLASVENRRHKCYMKCSQLSIVYRKSDDLLLVPEASIVT
jgi:hypothetical protein